MRSAKQLPHTGKRNRNIFIKTYNRLPRNRRKRALVLAQIVITAAMSRLQLLKIISEPIPKYYPAGSICESGIAIVGEVSQEMVELAGCKSKYPVPSFSFKYPMTEAQHDKLKNFNLFNGGEVWAVMEDNSFIKLPANHEEQKQFPSLWHFYN